MGRFKLGGNERNALQSLVDQDLSEDYELMCGAEPRGNYREECQKAGVDPNDKDNRFYDGFAETVSEGLAYWESEEAHLRSAEKCAATVISAMQRCTCPWATIHRLDVRDSVIDVFRQQDWAVGHPTANDLINALSEGLEKLVQPRTVVIKWRMPGIKDKFLEPFRVPWSERRLGVAFSSDDADNTVLVEGHVTERAGIGFARAVRNIVGQCLTVASSLNSPLFTGQPAEQDEDSKRWRGADPMAPILDLDGPYSSTMVAPEDYMNFDLGLVRIGAPEDFQRFRYLLEWAFVPDEDRPARQTTEVTLRHAVWRLAELGSLGASPLAFIGCMAVAERCLSVLRFRRDEAFASFVSESLSLKHDARGRLEGLVKTRARVIHDLAYRVDSRTFWMARQLASVATHFLAAKLTATEGQPAKLGEVVEFVLGR